MHNIDNPGIGPTLPISRPEILVFRHEGYSSSLRVCHKNIPIIYVFVIVFVSLHVDI